MCGNDKIKGDADVVVRGILRAELGLKIEKKKSSRNLNRDLRKN